MKKIEERLNKLKLSERKKKPEPIQSSSKNWKIFKKLESLQDEEIAKNLKNLQIKSTVQSFKERQERRRNLRRKNYDSDEEDEEEARKLAEQIEISKKFFDNYEKQRKQNLFIDSDDDMDSGFGKKQKKDIKGMIKKILLYGGLPTLLVVSLGVLSNKKFGKGKIKKNIKVKVNEEEKRFKQSFVKKIKEIILKRKQELGGMKEINRLRVEQEVKRLKRIGGMKEVNRQKAEQEIKRKRDRIADAALRRQLKNKLKIKQPPSNPQQSVVTPPSKKTRLEIIKERQQQKIPSNKIFIRINKGNREWSVEEEKNSNYYIKNRKIYNKKGRNTKYIYTEEDGLALKTNNDIVSFFKTEKLKRE